MTITLLPSNYGSQCLEYIKDIWYIPPVQLVEVIDTLDRYPITSTGITPRAVMNGWEPKLATSLHLNLQKYYQFQTTVRSCPTSLQYCRVKSHLQFLPWLVQHVQRLYIGAVIENISRLFATTSPPTAPPQIQKPFRRQWWQHCRWWYHVPGDPQSRMLLDQDRGTRNLSNIQQQNSKHFGIFESLSTTIYDIVVYVYILVLSSWYPHL